MVLIQMQVVLENFRFPGREPVIDTFKKGGGTYHNWGSTRPGAGHLVEADHWGLHHWWSLLLYLNHQAFLVSTGHSPKKYLFWALHSLIWYRAVIKQWDFRIRFICTSVLLPPVETDNQNIQAPQPACTAREVWKRRQAPLFVSMTCGGVGQGPLHLMMNQIKNFEKNQLCCCFAIKGVSKYLAEN